ncbi:MAG: hypothetical protein J7L32_04215, partial [Thermoplasmata archaeon]|nr:hypothetical protein [Thermoplasmata archaeon]
MLNTVFGKSLVFVVITCFVLTGVTQNMKGYTGYSDGSQEFDDNGSVTSHDESPSIQWQKTYGTDNVDWGNCIQQTSDGGYIITGAYDRDWWSPWPGYFNILKLDSNGNKQWQYLHGGNIAYNGHSVIETNDNKYVAVGEVGYATTTDVFMVKTDNEGNEQWNKTFGGADYDSGSSIKQTSDGGFIIAGTTSSFTADGYSDIWLIKTDNEGNEQWNKTFGGPYTDVGYDIQLTTDNGYIMTGYTETEGGGNKDVIVIKTDSNGNLQWQKTFGNNENDEIAYSIKKTVDGGYILGGCIYNYSESDTNAYMLKIDASGNEQWHKVFGGDEYDEVYCVQQTNDGGYILTGVTQSFSSSEDLYIIKTNSSGNQKWYKTVSATPLSEDVGNYVIQTDDYGYTITGYTGSTGDYDIYIVKLNHENLPPIQPQYPRPPDKAVDVDVNVELQWYCSDPDDDPLTFDVYFGTNNPPAKIVSGQTSRRYDPPGSLETNTTYYWKIVAYDNHNHQTSGPTWEFTTAAFSNNPPYTPNTPHPENGSTNV